MGRIRVKVRVRVRVRVSRSSQSTSRSGRSCLSHTEPASPLPETELPPRCTWTSSRVRIRVRVSQG